jgi:hypothetical protein
MKRIALLFVILSVISCTKEKEPNSIVGTWNLTEIVTLDPSSPIRLTGSEVSVSFNKDGSFNISGQPNYTFLRDLNRYEMVSNDRIRFFNTTTQDELFAYFGLDKTLSLFYQVRCPYEEKFIRR